MEDLEAIGTNEVLTKEVPSQLETPEAREYLKSAEADLQHLSGLGEKDLVERFASMESRVAELEGRTPRSIEVTKLTEGDIRPTDEAILLDEASVDEGLADISPENLESLKKEVFSKNLDGKSVSFGSSCSDCSGSCKWTCSGSDKCYAGKH